MDVSWQKLVVLAAAAVFAAFLLWKYRPTLPLPKWRNKPPRPTGGALDGAAGNAVDGAAVDATVILREARESARKATTPRDRAASLVRAAKAAAVGQGETAAMGFYLRAMKADATFCDAIIGITELLRAERPELLETVLWRRLSHLSWSGATAPAARCAAEALVSLYRRELRHRERARALQKLVGMLG